MLNDELAGDTGANSRRAAMVEARRSKRPSRGDRPAGATTEPDHVLADAGFAELLRRTLASARAAADLPGLIETMLTLDGHLPPASARRSLTREESVAVEVLTRPGRDTTEPTGQDVVFTSAFALGPQGRLVVTVPGRRTLPGDAAATGVAARVPWNAADLAEYQLLVGPARAEGARELAECRALLDSIGPAGRAGAVDILRSAVFLVPPVMFYYGDTVYSNLSDPGNLTGKTLLPSHPDCFFHHLDKLPFELWTDAEVMIVACLWLLYLSGGPNRVESSNGWQLSLRNVTDNLARQCELYTAAGRPVSMPAGDPPSAADLHQVTEELARARSALIKERRLYYEINATTRRKAELLFVPRPGTDAAEQFVLERLEAVLPTGAADLAAVVEHLRADRDWLAAPTALEPTGFETVIRTVVTAAVDLLHADFAMSRGLRSLPKLADALADRDWAEIVSWELPSFYCCVVPSAGALALYDGDHARVADSAWAIASRMQYNTWHVMPGNLPKDPAVQARDFLAPHVLPDIAVHSDLHHRGHVANNIRFSARSPETVPVAGFPFKSLTDIRVLRCEGPTFDEDELHAVTRMARFLAMVSELVADTAVTGGPRIEVSSFDQHWYRRTIITEELARHV